MGQILWNAHLSSKVKSDFTLSLKMNNKFITSSLQVSASSVASVEAVSLDGSASLVLVRDTLAAAEFLAGGAWCSLVEASIFVHWPGARNVKVDLALDLVTLRLGEPGSALEALILRPGSSASSVGGLGEFVIFAATSVSSSVSSSAVAGSGASSRMRSPAVATVAETAARPGSSVRSARARTVGMSWVASWAVGFLVWPAWLSRSGAGRFLWAVVAAAAVAAAVVRDRLFALLYLSLGSAGATSFIAIIVISIQNLFTRSRQGLHLLPERVRYSELPQRECC